MLNDSPSRPSLRGVSGPVCDAPYSGRVIGVRSNAACRWVDGDDRKELDNFIKKEAINLAYDAEKSLAYLAPSEWRLNHVREQWPAIRFHKTRGI